MFKLRLPKDSIAKWSSRYSDFYDDSDVESLGQIARSTGYLTAEQFRTMARWKTPRSQSRCLKNSETFVREVTSAAFSASEPRFKVEVLRLLDGVDWPTASVFLHFCDKERWPIIDYRAFWSLGQGSPAGKYSFALWDEYSKYARQLAEDLGISMRALDRALWAYSKVNQREATS